MEAAIEQRRKFFEAKRDHLYQIEIFYCILLEGARSKTGVGAAIARILRDPAGAVDELKVQFTNDSMKTLLRTHIEHDLRRLDQQRRMAVVFHRLIMPDGYSVDLDQFQGCLLYTSLAPPIIPCRHQFAMVASDDFTPGRLNP